MIDITQQKGLNYYSALRHCIEQYLHYPVKQKSAFDLPANSFNPLRNQYDASALLRILVPTSAGKDSYSLFIVKVDLYVTGKNYIFGLADSLMRAAIISSFRFQPDKTIEHLRKEAIHELGHLLGLKHCSLSTCAMHFSQTVEDTERKNFELCSNCRRQLEAI